MTFKKLLWPVVCVICLIFLFSIYTAGQKKKQAPVPGNTRTITDMRGRTFEVADPLERTRGIPKDQRKKVFQGYNPSHLVTLGGDTFMQERIEITGCLNAAQSVTTIGQRTGLHSGLGEVSMEQVLDWNPDILVINYGTPDDVYADPQWQQIRAVADRQVYPQPAGVFIFNRPTAESAAIFPLWLAGIAYPDKFSDVCIPCLGREFYGEVFDFDLTDSQVTQVLDGTYETRIMKGARH
jgi:iron complex transport system substrate-binding protein